MKQYVSNRESAALPDPLDMPVTLPARNRKFIEDLADDLHLEWKTAENEEGERHLRLSFPNKVMINEDDEDYDLHRPR